MQQHHLNAIIGRQLQLVGEPLRDMERRPPLVRFDLADRRCRTADSPHQFVLGQANDMGRGGRRR